MIYINAYNGKNDCCTAGNKTRDNPKKGEGVTSTEGKEKSYPTDFSSWQMGAQSRQPPKLDFWSEAKMICETIYETLGEPKGSCDAVKYFRDGIESAISAIIDCDKKGMASFTYLYTSHPDKHMHALGVDHPEVGRVIRGIDKEIERLWECLGDQEKLFSVVGKGDIGSNTKKRRERKPLDASVVVSADHGHITVKPEEMYELPSEIIECLEYANLGVHGKASLICQKNQQHYFPGRQHLIANISFFCHVFFILCSCLTGEACVFALSTRNATYIKREVAFSKKSLREVYPSNNRRSSWEWSIWSVLTCS